MLMTLKKPAAEAAVGELLGALERRLTQSPLGNCALSASIAFVGLCKAESCGKCGPCRIGLWQMAALLEEIGAGSAGEERLALLQKTARVVYETADCAVGWEAARLVQRCIEAYPEEFGRHVRGGTCSGSGEGIPCVRGCPARVDIPGYIALTAAGRHDDAIRLIRANNPFPAVCGLICEHPCEARCRRVILDSPVNIRGFKRFASEHCSPAIPMPQRAANTGKRVAVIGGGPAGLTAAYFLSLMGHEAAVYEKRKFLGGMLRYGIPSYRLPRERLQWDIDAILSTGGITVAKEIDIGDEIWLESLRGSYDAVFIAIGAHSEKRLGLPGENLRGIISAVEMLRLLGAGEENKLPEFAAKRVAVIGGGNVAMDAARSALRLGAAEVNIIYRRRREDMTALPEEIDEALSEGCSLVTLQAPLKFEGNVDDEVCAVWTEPQIPGPIEGGRPKPVKAAKEPRRIPCELVIAAVGQDIDSGKLALAGVKTKRALIVTSAEGAVEGAGGKPVAGVFAGGDCVTGPATVIRAIETGRVAAFNIDRYLGFNHHIESGVKDIPPPPLGDKKLWGRVQADPMTQEEMRQEAGRCLRCDAFGLAALRRN